MNKRIKELAEQAGGSILINGLDSAVVFGEFDDFKKFAELIVRECISTLEEKIYRSIDNEGDEIWADLILKEHFGVKE